MLSFWLWSEQHTYEKIWVVIITYNNTQYINNTCTNSADSAAIGESYLIRYIYLRARSQDAGTRKKIQGKWLTHLVWLRWDDDWLHKVRTRTLAGNKCHLGIPSPTRIGRGRQHSSPFYAKRLPLCFNMIYEY